jgi:hypothetical protein
MVQSSTAEATVVTGLPEQELLGNNISSVVSELFTSHMNTLLSVQFFMMLSEEKLLRNLMVCY